MERETLITALEELLSDEYSAESLVRLENDQLIEKIIHAALWYKDAYNEGSD